MEYYLIVEADFCRVKLFFKNDTMAWETEEFNQIDDIIPLPRLSIVFPVTEIYSGLKWVTTPS